MKMSSTPTSLPFKAPTTPLYHYTGLPALKGMIDHGSVWASSVHYMNDMTELNYACERVIELLAPYKAFGGALYDKALIDQFNQWIESIPGTVSKTVCAFSFSEKKNLLSQWRSYTPHGKGVCIEFTPEQVTSMTSSTRLMLGKCIYEKDEQMDFAGKILQTVQAAAQYERSLESPKTLDTLHYSYLPTFERYAPEIFQLLALIKHPSFSEEREWRLVSTVMKNFEGCQFREGKSMLVPFIKIALSSPKPFRSVMLGPTGHSDLSFASLRAFLGEKCEYVDVTDTPYREF